MALRLFNPNIMPKQATPTGATGAYGREYLPFTGYWFASGQEITFLSAEKVQRPSSRITLGITKPNVFQKDASSCRVGV